jgi:hypothetical protein
MNYALGQTQSSLIFFFFKLFQLSGQADPEGHETNYDLYLGMNRVVDGAYRSGSGLCKVSIAFHKS